MQLFERWQKNPLQYLEEAVCIDKLFPGGLSSQQREATRRLGAFYRAKWKKAMGEKLSENDSRLSKKIGVSIRAGQGPGKTLWGALILHWHLNCHYNAIAPCFGPKAEQLKATLFKSLSTVIDHVNTHGHPTIRGKLKVQSDKIYHDDVGSNKYAWAAFIKTAQNVSGEGAKGIAAQGDHAKHMLIITEESSATELESVFPVIEGTIQSDPLNFILMIGNPNRDKGYFYDSHHSMSEHWLTLKWSNEDCEFIPRESIERAAAKHGRDSNFFRVRVLGEFPLQDSDAYLPNYAIDAAFDDHYEPCWETRPVISVDVAGAGSDMSIILVRRGNDIGPIYSFKSVDRMAIANWILGLSAEIDPVAIIVDSNGIGDGVYSRLRELGLPAYGISSHTASRKPDKFHRIRDELLWKMREPFMRGAIKINTTGPDIPAERAKKTKDDLKEELSILKYEEGNKLRFIDKQAIKRRLGRSPDLLDALWMSFYFEIDTIEYMSGQLDAYDEEWEEAHERIKGGWLGI